MKMTKNTVHLHFQIDYIPGKTVTVLPYSGATFPGLILCLAFVSVQFARSAAASVGGLKKFG